MSGKRQFLLVKHSLVNDFERHDSLSEIRQRTCQPVTDMSLV